VREIIRQTEQKARHTRIHVDMDSCHTHTGSSRHSNSSRHSSRHTLRRIPVDMGSSRRRSRRSRRHSRRNPSSANMQVSQSSRYDSLDRGATKVFACGRGLLVQTCCCWPPACPGAATKPFCLCHAHKTGSNRADVAHPAHKQLLSHKGVHTNADVPGTSPTSVLVLTGAEEWFKGL